MVRRAFGMMRELTHGWRNWFRRARTEFVDAAHQQPPGRLQSVKQALPTSTGLSQNFHNLL
jgi:hypothetical protein